MFAGSNPGRARTFTPSSGISISSQSAFILPQFQARVVLDMIEAIFAAEIEIATFWKIPGVGWKTNPPRSARTNWFERLGDLAFLMLIRDERAALHRGQSSAWKRSTRRGNVSPIPEVGGCPDASVRWRRSADTGVQHAVPHVDVQRPRRCV